MPSFDIVKHSELKDSYRVQSVIGAFDLDVKKLDEHFTGNIDIEGKEWNVGLIVGGSGTGKTTIAREIFGDCIYAGMPHSGRAVIDDMPTGCSIQEIERMFTSVGFASPPNWLRPYSVLSNGEKMRCDLAYALLDGKDIVVYDEFTSVVNRQVAKAASFAISKCVRSVCQGCPHTKKTSCIGVIYPVRLQPLHNIVMARHRHKLLPIPRADTESILEAGKVWAGKAKFRRAQTKRRIKCTDGEDGVAPKNYILVRLYRRGR